MPISSSTIQIGYFVPFSPILWSHHRYVPLFSPLLFIPVILHFSSHAYKPRAIAHRSTFFSIFIFPKRKIKLIYYSYSNLLKRHITILFSFLIKDVLVITLRVISNSGYIQNFSLRHHLLHLCLVKILIVKIAFSVIIFYCKLKYEIIFKKKYYCI